MARAPAVANPQYVQVEDKVDLSTEGQESS